MDDTQRRIEEIQTHVESIIEHSLEINATNTELRIEIIRLRNEINDLLLKQKEHIQTIDDLRERHINLTRENDEMRSIPGGAYLQAAIRQEEGEAE